MSDYVTLIGAEEVSRAGYAMRDAASTMQSAASFISHSLEAHQRFLENWLNELNGTLQDRTSDLGVVLGPQA